MINPTAMFRIKKAWGKFTKNHPRLVPFFNAVDKKGVEEGTIIKVTVTSTDGTNFTTNIKVKPEDMELFNEMRQLIK